MSNSIRVHIIQDTGPLDVRGTCTAVGRKTRGGNPTPREAYVAYRRLEEELQEKNAVIDVLEKEAIDKEIEREGLESL